MSGVAPAAAGPNRRFATADGRARFAAVTHLPPRERADAAHPFVPNTGRLRVAEGGQRHIDAFVTAGLGRAGTWLRPWLEGAPAVDAWGTRLLSATPPASAAGAPPADPICTCFNISAAPISAAPISADLPSCRGTEGERPAQLQSHLKCGTNCGSCIPALRKLVRSTAPAPAPEAAPA